MEMNREGIAIAKPYLVRTVVHGGELAKSYHPVHSYLESLPEWDGTKRIEPLFRRVTDDDQLLAWLRKWFIAMVAQVIGRMGTYGNSVCPILISHKQGWGKSQFAKMLIPPTLKTFYSDTFNLAQEEACLRRMTAYMLINVDEVDRFRDARMPTFKNMVQMATVSMKRAYHSQMEEKERMASFIATSNRRYLLCDETGSRRFICVELARPIDVDTPIDYPQLYAEAMAALKDGERYWFDEEETRLLEAHNSAYAVGRGVWDLLRRHFAVCAIEEEAQEVKANLWSASEVYDYLHEISPNALEGIDRHNFGFYLKQLGAQQVRLGNRRVYGVKVKG
jgi:predicted P-loop ATPase